MIKFNRYPHVLELIHHYAKKMKNEQVLNLLETEVSSKDEALMFGKFILTMIDHIALDMQNGVSVLGSTDNTSMIPDIDYEMSLYLANRGLEEIWDKVCDEN